MKLWIPVPEYVHIRVWLLHLQMFPACSSARNTICPAHRNQNHQTPEAFPQDSLAGCFLEPPALPDCFRPPCEAIRPLSMPSSGWMSPDPGHIAAPAQRALRKYGPDRFLRPVFPHSFHVRISAAGILDYSIAVSDDPSHAVHSDFRERR